MIIKGRGGDDIAVMATSTEWGTESWIPAPGLARLSQAGLPITELTAYGIPALSSIIRQASELVASMPFMVYDDSGSYRRQARDSWQWRLLHDKPGYELNPFEFFYDINISLEATQNAFIQKVKAPLSRRRTRLVGFNVLDPQRVKVRRADDGTKLFDVYVGPNEYITDLTTEDILHIRGFTLHPGDVGGTSMLDLHRDPIGNAVAMQKFEGDYFRNNAVPPIFFTGAANRQQAQDLIDLHNGEHRGVGKQWKVGSLWGNADVKHIPISLRDAMFIEEKNISIEDICRIWHWPRMLMEVGEVREAAIDYNIADMHIMKVYVLPRLRRIETAFNSDEDLFFGTQLFGEFLTAAMERADTHTRYDAYRLARQGGWVTANELRELENFPPHENGDELQMTPVGGAPNPEQRQPNNGNTPSENAQLSEKNSDMSQPEQLQMPLVFQLPAPVVNVTTPDVRLEQGSIQVTAEPPDVVFAEGSIMVEAAPTPDIHVSFEAPPPADNRVQFAPGAIQIESAPTPDVHVTVEPPENRIEFAEGAIVAQPPDVHVNVEAPENRIEFAEGSIVAQPPDVHVSVEAPPPAETKVEFAEGAIVAQIEQPPPAEVNVTVEAAPTPDVNVTVEAAPTPDVNVTVEPPPPTEVKFHKGAIQVDAPAAPDVHVTVEAQEPPQVTVQAAPQPDVKVDVHLPEDQKPRKAKASRKPDGSIEIVYDEDREE